MNVTFAKDKNKKSLDLKVKSKQIIDKIPSGFYYFLFLLVVGIGFYFLMLCDNNFSLAYGGDFTAQYVPMAFHVWDYFHEWMSTGHISLFDPNVYLGVNSIGSNAYYGLFSPFNLIIILLPRSVVPQSMAISSICKIATAGLFFSMYMKYLNVKETTARICGIAYGFCGWGAFYLWYNNYQDILVFFPLILLGIEKVLKERKPWVLMVGVFFLEICNYVLFVPYIICAFIYAMFRFFQKVNQRTIGENLSRLGYGVVGFLGGILMGLVIFLPAFMATINSPKIGGYSYLGELKNFFDAKQWKEFFGLIFSWKKAPDQHSRILSYRVYYPIIEFFFPATTCRSLPTLELYSWDFDDMAVSLWVYLPITLFLFPSILQSIEEKKWSHIIAVILLTVSLFTPFMYFLTMGFTNGYARWTLFIATSLIAYVGTYIDRIPNVKKWHMHIGLAFSLAGILTSWYLTWHLANENPTKSAELMFRFKDQAYGNINFTNIVFLIETVYVIAQYLIILFLYDKKYLYKVFTIFITIEAIAMGNMVTIGHGEDSSHNNGYALNGELYSLMQKINKEDASYFRTFTSVNDAYSNNNGMMSNYGGLSFFHSLYNFNINDFTLWTGLRGSEKSVSGIYRGKCQDTDNLLGVKYYVISKKKSKYNEISQTGEYIANVPFDCEEMPEKETDNFKVYKNTRLAEFANTYDDIYYGEMNSSRSDLLSINNSMFLNTTAVLKEKDASEIKQLYPSLNVSRTRNHDSSLIQLSSSTNYNKKFYDLNRTAKNYDFNKIVDIPNDFNETTYNANKTMNYFTFYESVNDEPLFKQDTTVYIRAPFSGSSKYNFYFIDENNHIFMFDSHDDDTTDNLCYYRAFYIKKDVKKLAVCGKYYQSYFYDSTIKMYSETKQDFINRKQQHLDNPVTNIKYKQDYFAFNTNYSSDRFIVTKVAYDDGWSIKATNLDTKQKQNIKTYIGNGGFVSFVAPSGNYAYEMTYKTPYISLGFIASSISVTAFLTSLCGYYIINEKKKKKYLDEIIRN